MTHVHFCQLSRAIPSALQSAGQGGWRDWAAAVGADVSFPHHFGTQETDVSHQEPRKMQLGAKMSHFFVLQWRCKPANSQRRSPLAQSIPLSAVSIQGRGEGMNKTPVFSCTPKTGNLFKGSTWKLITWGSHSSLFVFSFRP